MNFTIHYDTGRSQILRGLRWFTQWDAISNAVARECECDADDVHVEEDDDGIEHLTANGKHLGTVAVYEGPTHHNWPTIPLFREAAE